MERRWQDGCLEKSDIISFAKKGTDNITGGSYVGNGLFCYGWDFFKE